MLTHQARFCSRAAGAIPSLRHHFSRNPALRYSALFVSGHLYRNFGQRAHQRTPNRSPNATDPIIAAIIGELKE